MTTTTIVSDAENLKRIAHGDADALEVWFYRCKDDLYSFVYYRVGGDEDLAADATQATFALALERLRDFDSDKGTMTNWLRFLSRNIIRDTLARHRRGVQLQAVWDRIDDSLRGAYEQIDSELLPDEVLQRDETRELVAVALTNIPPNYRDVLQAKYVDNQSLDDMATQQETTIDAVKSMLRRARAAFRDCFLTIAKTEMSDV